MKNLLLFLIGLLFTGFLYGQVGVFSLQAEKAYIQKHQIKSVKTYILERDTSEDDIIEKKLKNTRFYDFDAHLFETHNYRGGKDTIITKYVYNEIAEKIVPVPGSGSSVNSEYFTDSLGREVVRNTMPHLSEFNMTMTLETIYDETTGVIIENLYEQDEFVYSRKGIKTKYTKVMPEVQFNEDTKKWDTISISVDFYLGDQQVFSETIYNDPNSFMGRANRQYKVYDDVGRIIATFGFSQNGKMASEGRWEYNENGDLEGFTQMRNGIEVSSRENHLNKNGLITSSVFINSYGGVSQSKEYAYEYTFYDTEENNE